MGELDWRRVEALPAAARPEDAPQARGPQVAAAGASNVGKSSLLGALFGRPRLVRVSKKPGCTRLLHFYLVGGRLLVADLPGYGFARVSKAERARWAALIEGYFRRARPRLVLALIDARHGPKPADRQLIAWLNAEGLRWLPVATKADKLSRGERARRARAIEEALGVAPRFVSSRTGDGIEALRAAIEAEAFGAQP